MDAQYFSKSAVNAELQIKQGSWGELRKVAERVESFGAYALTNLFSYVEVGIPFLRCLNIRDGFVDFSNVLYITPQAHSLLQKSAVRPGMVLLTMSGSVGNAAVALDSWTYPINSNQDIAKITPKQNMDPYYLVAFLISRYGQVQMERLPVGSVQQHIFLWMIEKVAVSRFSERFEETVGEQVLAAYKKDISLVSELENAEQIFLRALGLEGWQPPEPKTYTRRASEVFAAGRLDAEHFQPKFDALTETIRSSGLPLVSLGDLILPVKNGYDFREFVDEGTPYIRVSDIKNCRIDLDGAQKVAISSSDIRKNINLRVGDVLFTRKGSFGNAAPVREGEQHAIISSEIMLIRRKPVYEHDILPEFLSMYFNSIAGTYQADKWAHGVAFYSITQDDLNSFLVPILKHEDQMRLKERLDNAELARLEAHALLERAKRAVEIAIEENEEAALDYLTEVD